MLSLCVRLSLPLLVALVAAAALAPARAHARADLGAAVRVADAVFPAVKQRCGSVSIEIGALTAVNALASAESWIGLCKVRYAPRTFEFATQAQLCSLTVHEWGHLAGLGHSPDPNHFMHETVPHHPACGPSDQQAADARAAAVERTRQVIERKLSGLRRTLRATRRAHRRARGARRVRLARKVRRLRSRIERLSAEYHALPAPVRYVVRPAG